MGRADWPDPPLYTKILYTEGAVEPGQRGVGGCSAARRATTVFWFVMYNSYGFRLPGNTCVSVSARYTHTHSGVGRQEEEAAKGEVDEEGRGMRVTVLNNPQTKMRCCSPFYFCCCLFFSWSGCQAMYVGVAGGWEGRWEWGRYTEINK